MANDNNNTLKEGSITGETPGKLLAKQRKKSNISEREAADALKISVGRLKSIEDDDFSVFPSETYIKGHLKNYSRLLKCHEEEILSAYKLIQPEIAAEPINIPRGVPEHHQHKRWWLVYGALVLFALVWGLSYWLLGSQNEPQDTEVFPESGAVQAIESDEVVTQSLPEEASSLGFPVPSHEVAPADPPALVNDFSSTDSLPHQEGLAPTVEPSSEEVGLEEVVPDEQPLVVSKLTAAELVQSIKAKEEEKAASIEARIEGDTLSFGFERASWIQVTDGTGKVLFKGLNKSGAELVLNGTAPFNIVIGNVEGTSLVYNGENVTLDAPVGKKILRLTLGG